MSAFLLAKMALPPAGHPLREYAEQQVHTTTGIYDMQVVQLVAMVFFIVAFFAFAWQKWRERQDIKREREDIKTWRAEVVDLSTACAALLASAKARGAALEVGEERKADKVVQAAAEMKAAVAAVPEKTAEKVVSALEEKRDSGILQRPQQPPELPIP